MFDRRIVVWLNFRIIELGSTGITKSNQLGGNMTGQSASLVFKTGPRKFDHQKASSQVIPKQKKTHIIPSPNPGMAMERKSNSCFIMFYLYHRCSQDFDPREDMARTRKSPPASTSAAREAGPGAALRPRAVPAAPKSCPSRCCASCTVSLAEMTAGRKKSSVLGDGKHG